MRMFKNIGLIGVLAFTILLGCSDGDTVFDQIVDNETRGAVLRTVEVLSNEIAIDLENGTIAEGAFFGVILEAQDQGNGSLTEFVEVYVGFRDNTGGENTKDEILSETIPASEFSIGEFGLPRFEYSATGDELLAELGLAATDLEGGDQFTIRFESVLTTGQRFSFDDNTGTLTGSFFSSPFLYTPGVVCSVDPEFFTGEYSITQLSGSAPFGIGDAFTQPSVTVVANGDTNRTFDFSYDPGGFGSAYRMSIDLVCGEFQNVSGAIAAGGLGCGDGSIGQTGSATVITTYDQSVGDASFTITFNDFEPDGGCGGEYEAVIRMDKIN